MYQGWEVERWETPVSDAKSLVLISLVDDGSLTITVEDVRGTPRRRWRFTFDRVPAYCNILEEYRLGLWEHISGGGQRLGWTLRVTQSPWLVRMVETEPQLSLCYPTLLHFQIGTEHDVLDVVAPEPPTIVEREPAPPDAPLPGRARVLYHPEDRDKIKQELRRFRMESSVP